MAREICLRQRDKYCRTSEGCNLHKVKLRLNCAVPIYEREQYDATMLSPG